MNDILYSVGLYCGGVISCAVASFYVWRKANRALDEALKAKAEAELSRDYKAALLEQEKGENAKLAEDVERNRQLRDEARKERDIARRRLAPFEAARNRRDAHGKFAKAA